MEAIMAICLPFLLQKPVFNMPISPPVAAEVREDYVQPGAIPSTTRTIGRVGDQLPTPYYLPQEVPQNEYPPVPEGVQMITVCYKNDAGEWLLEQRTLYSGNWDTRFEDSEFAYEYQGVCPR